VFPRGLTLGGGLFDVTHQTALGVFTGSAVWGGFEVTWVAACAIADGRS